MKNPEAVYILLALLSLFLIWKVVVWAHLRMTRKRDNLHIDNYVRSGYAHVEGTEIPDSFTDFTGTDGRSTFEYMITTVNDDQYYIRFFDSNRGLPEWVECFDGDEDGTRVWVQSIHIVEVVEL